LNTDPKALAGIHKTPLHLIPPLAKTAQANVHALGAKKYGSYNWRENNVALTVYLGAMLRHIDAVLMGEDTDPESGEHHLAHVAAGCNIVIDAKAFGTLVDDRKDILKLQTRPN
jgi:hypothetical protein